MNTQERPSNIPESIQSQRTVPDLLGQAALARAAPPNMNGIDAAIDALEAAASAETSVASNVRSSYFQELAKLWIAHYDFFQEPRDLAQALGFATEAVTALEEEDPGRIPALLTLAQCRRARYDRMRKKKDLQEMLALSTDVMQLCEVGHPFHAAALENCAETFYTTFSSTSNPDHLDAAISVGEQVLDGYARDTLAYHAAAKHLSDYLINRFRLQKRKDDIDRAVLLRRERLGADSNSSVDRSPCLGQLASALIIRYLSISNLQDIDEAVQLRKESLDACFPGSPSQTDHLFDYVSALKLRVMESSTPCIMDHLLSCYRQLLDLMALDHPERGAVLASFAATLHMLASRNPLHHRDKVEECIAVWREVVRLCTEGDKEYTSCLAGLADALGLQLNISGAAFSIAHEIVTLRQQALDQTSKEDPSYPDLLMELAEALYVHYKYSREMRDLEEAAAHLEKARSLGCHAEQDAVHIVTMLGDIVYLQLTSSGSPSVEAWDNLVSLREEALRLCATATASDRPKLHELLAIALQNTHLVSWRPQYLERAVVCHREAVESTPDEAPHKPELLLNLSKALMTLHLVANDPAPIEEALKWNRYALQLLPGTTPSPVEYSRSLADTLRRRYMYAGDEKDVEEALELLNKCVNETNDLKDRLLCMDSLAITCRSRYSVTQDVMYLHEAQETHEKALGLVSAEDDKEVWRDLVEGLVRDLRDLSEELSNADLIVRAISMQKDVVQSYSECHSDRAGAASLLVQLLLSAYSRTVNPEYLEDIISLCRQELGTNATGIARLLLLSSCCNALRMRIGQFKDPRDMEELTSLERQMMDFQIGGKFDFSTVMLKMDPWIEDEAGGVVTPEERDRAYRGAVNRYNLIYADVSRCRRRFEESGKLEDMDDAISICKSSIMKQFLEKSQQRMSLCSLLASLYRKRYGASNLLGDIDSAIEWAQQALDSTPESATAHDKRSFELALFMLARYRGLNENEKDSSSLGPCLQLLEDLSKSSNSEIYVRFDAAMNWAKGAAEASLQNSALSALRALFAMLPKLAWLGSDTRASLYAITAARNLPSQAALYALRYSTVEEAVEFLEAGRAVIWTQATRLRRPVDDVASAAPRLAARLHTISQALQEATVKGNPSGNGANEGVKLRRQWFDVVDEIKQLPGFEDFLDYSSYSSFSDVSREGPVVILVDDEKCCIAIILSSPDTSPKRVPLAITLKKLQVLHSHLKTTVNSRSGPNETADTVELSSFRAGRVSRPRSSTEDDVLAILWKEVAEPIVQHLTNGITPKLDERRRLWWCCVGYFSFMPIHAAGRYKGRDKVGISDFFISSYTPTLRTLMEARGRPTPVAHKVLPIIQPNPGSGFSALPKTKVELQEIYNIVPVDMLLSLGPNQRMDLEGEYATLSNVVAKLDEASILHLACHGVQETLNPLRSGFVLRDGERLTVELLMNQRLPLASTAFLSACYTASSDVERLDEAINLANGMLFAGFSSVSATMWPMGDAEGPVVTRAVYQKLFQSTGGRPDARMVATALDAALRELRKTVPWEQWAVFIHLGI